MEKNCDKHFASECSLSFCLNEKCEFVVPFDSSSDEDKTSLCTDEEWDMVFEAKIACEVSKMT